MARGTVVSAPPVAGASAVAGLRRRLCADTFLGGAFDIALDDAPVRARALQPRQIKPGLEAMRRASGDARTRPAWPLDAGADCGASG